MPPSPLAPAALIVGCGFLGRHVARLLLDHGVIAFGSTRSQAHAAQLAAIGVRPLLLSVTQPVTLAALRPAIDAERLDLYYLIPPAPDRPDDALTPRQVAVEGPRNILAALNAARIRRAVMTSSTLVYGQTGNAPVTADTPAQPATERARLLLESENIFRAAGPRFHVVRLAGLYGPGRIIGLAAVRDGSPLAGNPDSLINLIHVDDAADLLVAVMCAESPAPVELGSDGRPVPRQTYYHHLARMLGVAPPQTLDDRAAANLGLDPARLRSASSKSCDNTPTCLRNNWQPRFADFRMGLEQALAKEEKA